MGIDRVMPFWTSDIEPQLKETVVKHGEEQVKIWRRSFDLPPPEIDEASEFNPTREAKYRGLDPKDIPKTESLKTVIDRVMPFWTSDIEPQLKEGKTVFVCATATPSVPSSSSSKAFLM